MFSRPLSVPNIRSQLISDNRAQSPISCGPYNYWLPDSLSLILHLMALIRDTGDPSQAQLSHELWLPLPLNYSLSPKLWELNVSKSIDIFALIYSPLCPGIISVAVSVLITVLMSPSDIVIRLLVFSLPAICAINISPIGFKPSKPSRDNRTMFGFQTSKNGSQERWKSSPWRE